jgi:hypothetical protein
MPMRIKRSLSEDILVTRRLRLSWRWMIHRQPDRILINRVLEVLSMEIEGISFELKVAEAHNHDVATIVIARIRKELDKGYVKRSVQGLRAMHHGQRLVLGARHADKDHTRDDGMPDAHGR